MACISKHGNEIGRIVYTAKTKAWFSDCTVMSNHGDGWKISGKLKPEFTPEQAYQRAKEKYDAFLSERPAAREYRKCLHDLAGQCKRWKLHLAVQLMPDDCDGVWSEACDGYGDNISASVDEIAELCRLYGSAMIEQRATKQETETA